MVVVMVVLVAVVVVVVDGFMGNWGGATERRTGERACARVSAGLDE